MEDYLSSIESEAKYLNREISKDIAYFYNKHIPRDQTGNYSRVAGLSITAKERNIIDFSQGTFLSELSDKPKLSGYDVLKVEMKDKILRFYSSVQMSDPAMTLEGSLHDMYRDNFEKEKEEMSQNTINAVLKEISNWIIRGEPPLTTMN